MDVLGVDSLLVVELQLKIENRFFLTVPAMDFGGQVTINQLAARILELLEMGEDEADEVVPRASEIDVEALSDAQVEEMLASLEREGEVF